MARPKSVTTIMRMRTVTCTRTPATAGKSTIPAARRRRAPALPSRGLQPPRRNSPVAPAVGRAQEAIHHGPIENSRRAPRARTDSTASARAKPEGLAERKAASVVARVVRAVASVVGGEVDGRIDLVPGQKAPPGASVAVGSDGDKKGV